MYVAFFHHNAERQSEKKEYGEFSEGDEGAGKEKTAERKSSVRKEKSDFKADDQTVKESRHQRSQNRQMKETDVPQEMHRSCGEQAGMRTENDIERTEKGDRGEIGDDTPDSQTGDSGRCKNSQNGQRFTDTELDCRRGGSRKMMF